MTAPLLELSPIVRDILSRSTTDSNVLRLPPGQLDRRTYEAVNKALDALGGKWNRKVGGHVFDRDPRPLVDSMLLTGAIPRKNPLAYFATPKSVVERMVTLAYVDLMRSVEYILEPSAGKGAIAVELLDYYDPKEIHLVEADDQRAQSLCDKGFDDVWCGDFLKWEHGRQGGYDLVMMNPPFAVERDASEWMAHVRKAHGLLAPKAVLVAVVPVSYEFRTDRKHVAFRDWAAEHGVLSETLPAGAFAESETWVNAMLIRLEAAQ